MEKGNRPGIYLETDTRTGISILLVGADGKIEHINRETPAEDLVAFTDLEFSYYHSAIQQLWDKHPLFEERSPVPISDYEDFELRAIRIMEMLRSIDPVVYFRVSQQMAEALALKDDGSPFPPR